MRFSSDEFVNCHVHPGPPVLCVLGSGDPLARLRALAGGCHLPGREGLLIGHRAEHAQRRVPADGCIPRSRSRPWLLRWLTGEVLDAPQFELQVGVPGQPAGWPGDTADSAPACHARAGSRPAGAGTLPDERDERATPLSQPHHPAGPSYACLPVWWRRHVSRSQGSALFC